MRAIHLCIYFLVDCSYAVVDVPRTNAASPSLSLFSLSRQDQEGCLHGASTSLSLVSARSGRSAASLPVVRCCPVRISRDMRTHQSARKRVSLTTDRGFGVLTTRDEGRIGARRSLCAEVALHGRCCRSNALDKSRSADCNKHLD